MTTADNRCTMPQCASKPIYRMIGSCLNCTTKDVLILYTAGHEADPVRCPICDTRELRPQRLATEDEIPAA